MKDLLKMVGLTKQALWKYNRREELNYSKIKESIDLLQQIRKKHKRMGCRSAYYATKTKPPVGRDAFIGIGYANGFLLKRRRNKRKTTWSQQIEVFPNLIEGKILTGINQVWQSDIFYHHQNGKDYYGVTIIDVYSRRLLSLHLSRSLRATENIKALQQAIKSRSGYDLNGCIFHSDRGSQYISDVHKQMLREYHMKPSMCKIPQQNAYAEKVQDTIKNGYLVDLNFEGKNLKTLSRYVTELYNDEKPHTSLSNMTPNRYEKYVEKLPKRERPKELIFKWDTNFSTKSELPTKRKK